MSRVALVVNPTAGKGGASRRLPEVAGILRDAGHAVEVMLSRNVGEARAMAQEAVGAETDVLAVMGGDGMMHLGLNTVAAAHRAGRTRTALGLVPAGTGNDLCRGVGLDPDDAVAAAHVIAAGHGEPLDLVAVNDRFVGAVVATGFDALVNRRANTMPWPKGPLRYVVAALAEIRVFTPLHYRLRVDGEVRELEAMLVAVGNTAYYGGGMQICPSADPRDGLLDLTIVHPVTRPTLLQMLPRMHTGTFVRHPAVERLRAREVVVEGAGLLAFGDGEHVADAPLAIRVAKGALRVLLPAAR
ncbi:MAG: diacylglycerol/lipid kinase family protein [Friedmanniella sp.]